MIRNPKKFRGAVKAVLRVPVTRRAAIQRINRRLTPASQQLRTCRSYEIQHITGEYFIVGGAEIETHVDLNELGRRLGVLKEWETVIEKRW